MVVFFENQKNQDPNSRFWFLVLITFLLEIIEVVHTALGLPFLEGSESAGGNVYADHFAGGWIQESTLGCIGVQPTFGLHV